ncbi:hypothetical protein DERP_007017 [Dermatophagoides pteronyssinus]|uniref:Secreted protein n=1 Tax=Dermatophagoides pteronyssinus TaxID=6956 RepID=A0ABQ8JU22_DERPT|nr:hypothetical protein DERP_007017 [Dermatophagoides pteronyssinus]
MEVGLVRLVQLVCQARLVRVVWGSSPSAVPPIVCPIVRLIVVVPIFADLQFLVLGLHLDLHFDFELHCCPQREI